MDKKITPDGLAARTAAAVGIARAAGELQRRYFADRASIGTTFKGPQDYLTVADGAVPVTLELLSPADRPIQITSDLPGFWAGSWSEVRREMAGRYPKHHWPADPSTAAPRRMKDR